MVVGTSIVLLLRSPLEDPLSAKRSIPIKRRVQAFVILAIAFFFAAGFAANRYVTAAHPSPADQPVTDSAVVPSPEGSAVKPPAPAPTHRKPHAQRPSHRPAAAEIARTAKPKPHSSTSAPAKVLSAEAQAVQLTNAQRAQHGCSALHVDSRLRTAARAHSKDMRVRGYFEHDSPDGKTPWDRIKAAGYTQAGAENIAMGYPTAKAVVVGWMNSPGHRANILNCSLKAVGIGVEYGSGGPWWTQDFGFQ
ncbi:MAG TPA: CAP domain-containing protein [Actinoallomurus sp.]|nr:CAP domain-containing protein [Actinoallomurus sp.]